ncbi:MAG TPA: glycosyl hydrolase [Tepidisphaeraceae bacterium]|jgi:hypothetical protein
MKRTAISLALMILAGCAHQTNPWPTPTMANRPWTRWWWLGSAVDEKNLGDLLRQYHDAGLGGVEICPIYGAIGYENRYIDFLSPRWMHMLATTCQDANQLGMGVDLTDGTGWPDGGPWVTEHDASSKLFLKTLTVNGGSDWRNELAMKHGHLACAIAINEAGEQRDVTNQPELSRGWWKIYALIAQQPVQKVKRAAPGGEGNVLDPFSPAAMRDYLHKFDQAFADYHGPMPEGHFHDSYEYYGASWTPRFLEEFKNRRGYDLREHMPAFFGEGDKDTTARLMHDYRQTVAELHLAYISTWTQWAHTHHGITREQAHGSPANLLDVYAAADIPETEVEWRTPIEKQTPMLKFASSAAHVTGKPLTSSETFTWAGEHFQVSLASLKPTADYLFCCGINHIFLHGIPYSPNDVNWPGWLFYASVNFGPQGGLWHDLPAMLAYITRCQSLLQAGKSSNDALLYFPVDDIWQESDEPRVIQFTTPGKWMWDQPFYALAMKLWQRGFGFDEVSDAQLSAANVDGGKIILGGNAYRVLVVPTCKYMPATTMRKLADLAEQGGRIVIEKTLAAQTPGLANGVDGREELTEARQQLLGSRSCAIAADEEIEKAIQVSGVQRESLVDSGLLFVRRIKADGFTYFLTNHSDQPINGWIPLATPCESAEILDPLFDDRAGLAAVRKKQNSSEIYLQMAPGKSLIIKTSQTRNASSAQNVSTPWTYWRATGNTSPIAGTWRIHFLQGGPVLPADFSTGHLASWTTLGNSEAKRFAGTARYSIEFIKPSDKNDDWVLDIGKVCDSARVRINGKEIGTLWCQPFALHVGKYLKKGSNLLEIDVTNLAANRIADLDRRDVHWKSFHEINFVDRNYEPFDASHWPERDSGLIGPVKLIGLKKMQPKG